MEMNNDEVSSELRMAEQETKLEMYKTATRKAQLIYKIKAGLGTDIKANPNRVKIIKKPLGERLKEFLARIFTKF